MNTSFIFFGTVDSSKDIIDHFHQYLSTEMDADLILQDLLIQHLLNDEEVKNLKNATSSYQKNCLLLERIRLMDREQLKLLCKLLQSLDSQKHIADALLAGKL